MDRSYSRAQTLAIVRQFRRIYQPQQFEAERYPSAFHRYSRNWSGQGRFQWTSISGEPVPIENMLQSWDNDFLLRLALWMIDERVRPEDPEPGTTRFWVVLYGAARDARYVQGGPGVPGPRMYRFPAMFFGDLTERKLRMEIARLEEDYEHPLGDMPVLNVDIEYIVDRRPTQSIRRSNRTAALRLMEDAVNDEDRRSLFTQEEQEQIDAEEWLAALQRAQTKQEAKLAAEARQLQAEAKAAFELSQPLRPGASMGEVMARMDYARRQEAKRLSGLRVPPMAEVMAQMAAARARVAQAEEDAAAYAAAEAKHAAHEAKEAADAESSEQFQRRADEIDAKRTEVLRTRISLEAYQDLLGQEAGAESFRENEARLAAELAPLDAAFEAAAAARLAGLPQPAPGPREGDEPWAPGSAQAEYVNASPDARYNTLSAAISQPWSSLDREQKRARLRILDTFPLEELLERSAVPDEFQEIVQQGVNERVREAKDEYEGHIPAGDRARLLEVAQARDEVRRRPEYLRADPGGRSIQIAQRLRVRLLGAWDAKEIQKARPWQTPYWYQRHSKVVWPIQNRDNLCLFYAMALARRLSRYREALLEMNLKTDEGKVVSAELKKRASITELRKIEGIKDNFHKGFPLAVEAEALAHLVYGDSDLPEVFSFDDVVRLHNYLKTLIILLTSDDGTYWQTAFRSDQAEGAVALDERQRPVVYLLYTPGANHVDLIPDTQAAAALLGQRGQICRVCLKNYSNLARHGCLKCKDCLRHGCEAPATLMAWNQRPIHCPACNARFKNEKCYDNHLKIPRGGKAQIRGQSIEQAQRGDDVEIAAVSLKNTKQKGKSKCQRFIYCDECHKAVPRFVKSPDGGRIKHVCHGAECAHCGEYATPKHLCMIQPPRYEPAENTEFLFIDCECHVDGESHEPYLIRGHLGFGDTDGKLGGYNWKGEDVGERLGDYDANGKRVKFFWNSAAEFADFLQNRIESEDLKIGPLNIFAHNGSGYDWPVLYPEFASRPTLKPTPVYRGSSLICVRLGTGKRAIRLLDSMLFVAGRLADYPKMFSLTAQLETQGYGGDKEFFPHWLGNESYEGTFPPRAAFKPQEILDKDRKEHFERWYADNSKKFQPHTDLKWSFMQQARTVWAKDYCDTDTQILRLAMFYFRRLFDQLTGGVDPFYFSTLPAAVFGAYRLKFMPKDSIANLSAPGELRLHAHPVHLYRVLVDRVLRRALKGGRTDGRTFYFEADPNDPEDGVCYFDFNSLYPTVMVKYPYPTGHPLYYGTHDVWPAAAVNLAGPCDLMQLERFMDPATISFLLVDVECPKTLHHPVLGQTVKRPGDAAPKFLFSLDDKTKYWTNSVELRLAIKMGYKVTVLHAVAHWPASQISTTLWSSWFRKFMPLKDSKGGYPRECKTEQQKLDYRVKYAQWPLNQGAELDDADIESNPGLKLVAKLLCNTLWGKMCQRLDLQMTKLFTEAEKDAFFELVFSEDYEIIRVIPIVRGEQECVEVVYSRPESYFDGTAVKPKDCLREGAPHAVHIGALVTAYARKELYEAALSDPELAPHVLYMDTDSVFVRRRFVKLLKAVFGPFLGQFKDELDGDYIVVFACAAPKVYVYITKNGKVKCVAKGFRRAAIAAEFMQKFVKASCIAHGLGIRAPAPHHVKMQRIARDRRTQTVRSDTHLRQFRFVASKVHVFVDGTSLPFGHAFIKDREFLFKIAREKWLGEFNKANADLEKLQERKATAKQRSKDDTKQKEKEEAKRDREELRLARARDTYARELERNRDSELMDSAVDSDELEGRNEWMGSFD